MGKYMKKCRGMAKVAVMEVVSQSGVTTRARTLAAAAAAAAAAASSSAAAATLLGNNNGELQIKYLELRSRRLVVTIAKEKQHGELTLISPEKAVTYGRMIPAERRDSRSSSYASSKFAHGEEASLDPGDNLTDIDCRERRETTPSSNQQGESSERLESIKRPGEAIRRKRRSGDYINKPPAEEMEEFFAAAEKQEQIRFAEKYNYDITKDVPLRGRYQWIRLKP